MKRRYKRECSYLASHNSRIGVIAVLVAFCGILMWVHGSMAPWLYQTVSEVPGTPNFTVFFLLWLLLYGCLGFLIAVYMLPAVFHSKPGLFCWAVTTLIYILLLAWYPLFFSGLHIFLACSVLFTACILQVFSLRYSLPLIRIMLPVQFLTILLEIYFLYVTISFLLLK